MKSIPDRLECKVIKLHGYTSFTKIARGVVHTVKSVSKSLERKAGVAWLKSKRKESSSRQYFDEVACIRSSKRPKPSSDRKR